jgi:molybdopterin converting factor small subunit
MTESKSLDFVLDFLLKITPPAYKNLITQKQEGEPFLRILVNEALVNEKEFSRSLSHNDLITLLPGISGG